MANCARRLPTLDPDQLGWSPYQRLYQCLEGWICVHCSTDDERAALSQEVGEAGDNDNDPFSIGFFGRTAADWVDALRRVAVPCTVVREDYWVHQFLRDPAAIAAFRATPYQHPQHGSVSAIGRIIQLRAFEPNEPAYSPRLGEHSREILKELGVAEEEIDQMIAAGLVIEHPKGAAS